MSVSAASASRPESRCSTWRAQSNRCRICALEGITFYPGHIKSLDAAGLDALAKLSATSAIDSRRFLLRAGIEVKIVSGGSTPALFHSHEVDGLNEIRPGTYVFNDVNTAAQRRLRAGGLRRERAGHRRFHRAPRPDDHRWRVEDVLFGPARE